MDVIDTVDSEVLLRHILRQAIDDYIKLQHPKFRQKKYLQEAFQDAVDMFFDPDYRFMHIKNEDGNDMSLPELLKQANYGRQSQSDRLKAYIVKESKIYWQNKELSALTIPDTMPICGHVYSVIHEDLPGYRVDYESHDLYLNKQQSSDSEETLIQAVTEILCYHEDLAISRVKREKLGKSLYATLKVNNSFRFAERR